MVVTPYHELSSRTRSLMIVVINHLTRYERAQKKLRNEAADPLHRRQLTRSPATSV